jgi:hypothetical protein
MESGSPGGGVTLLKVERLRPIWSEAAPQPVNGESHRPG